MKNFELQNWELSDDMEGLLFFALKWQEMLFDYSLDSYKNRVMNLPGICEELINTYDACEMGLISWKALEPIRDELLHLLKQDDIAQEIIGKQLDKLTNILKSWSYEENDKKRISYAASILKKKLGDQYFRNLKIELIRAVNNPHEKYKIKSLCNDVLTELIRLGYSRQYIYYRINSYFFSNGKTIDSTNHVKNFLDKFDLQTHEYEVYFILPKQCKLLSKRADPNFIDPLSEPNLKWPNDSFEQDFYENFDKKEQIIFKFGKIYAKDPYSARSQAEERLTLASSFVKFFIHKIEVESPENALVYTVSKNNKTQILSRPTKSTLKKSDKGEHTLEQSLSDILGPFISRQTHAHTRSRLTGALRSHMEGVKASAPQNQFSNLWTSLESLAESTSDDSTIRQIISNCIPLLCYKYFTKLIVCLDNDLSRCLKSKYEEIQDLRDENEKEIHFLVRFLVSDDFEDERSDLYSACDKNPLLRFRIFQLHKILTSPRKARELLRAHEQRLRWHIKRMYIARNLLVHGGLETRNLDLLVENLHAYVDRIMLEIVNVLRKDFHHPTFEKVFYEYDLKYKVYKSTLKELKSDGNKEKNASIIVFDH